MTHRNRDPKPKRSPLPERKGGLTGVRLGRIAGIEVRIDWSLLIIFALVTASLAMGLLSSWHPDWSMGLRWSVALLAALAFFGSVLAHEMSHALVGRTQGIRVSGITLFLFGGMAHMEEQPPRPSAELLMAIVGPITSLAIGIGSLLLASAVLDPTIAEAFAEDPERALAMIGPAETILMWLGPINILLAIFNLVPGFPLDGGRVFRAIAWWLTGDMIRATRWASLSGRSLAVVLMGLGVAMAFGIQIPFFGSGIGSGLWLLLIGWFLHKAATASYQQLVIREALRDVRVDQVMLRRFDTVGPDLTVERLVNEHVMQSDQEAFPVLRDGRLVGVVGAREAMRLPGDRWATTTVGSIMRSGDEVPTLPVEGDARDALRTLERAQVGQIPVVGTDGGLAGILRPQDIFKWLRIHSDELPA